MMSWMHQAAEKLSVKSDSPLERKVCYTTEALSMKLVSSPRITTIPLLQSVVVFAFLFLLFYPDHTFAQVGLLQGDLAGTGLLTQDLRVLLGNIIKAVLGLMGIVAVGVMIYGGVKYQLARGDEQLIAEAKSIIINGGIGLAIVIAAYAIVAFVLGAVKGNIGTPSTTEDSFINRNDIDLTGFGALGGGIIEMVAPAPYASDVPRNTSIQIKFKEQIMVDNLIDVNVPDDWRNRNCPSASQPLPLSCGYFRRPSFSMRTNHGSDIEIDEKDIVVTTYDGKTFTFKRARREASSQPFLFGNSKFPTPYKVTLNQILLQNGRLGLKGEFSWTFTVGTTIDTIPPRVVGILPPPPPPRSQETVPRNSLVQITFSEPISVEGVLAPVRVSGGFFGPNIESENRTLKITSDDSISHVEGNWSISNQFRTLTFQPLEPCAGENQPSILTSCGVPAMCLPSNTRLKVLIISFREATGIGIRDMADNALDGDPTKPEGVPPRVPSDFEDYSWNFNVGDFLDLIPPFICNIRPGLSTAEECEAVPPEPKFGNSPTPAYPGSHDATGEIVPPRTIPSMRFSEPLDMSSVNTTSIYLSRWSVAGKNCAENTGTGLRDNPDNRRPDDGACYNPFGVEADATSRVISLRLYGNNQNPPRPSLDPNQDYAVRVTNEVRDARQNCFNPTIINPSN